MDLTTDFGFCHLYSTFSRYQLNISQDDIAHMLVLFCFFFKAFKFLYILLTGLDMHCVIFILLLRYVLRQRLATIMTEYCVFNQAIVFAFHSF